ncbi:MAG: 4Fe-4S binding protein [Candidatus Helarchaeota archaeon]
MLEVNRHPNITLWTNTEVKDVSGFVGNFNITVQKNPWYVTDACNGCGACFEVCPIVLPNEFQYGLSPRKCIDISFAQAVPAKANIDMDFCVHCYACSRVCEVSAIDMSQEPETETVSVGTIIVATGWNIYNKVTPQYGLGIYDNVLNQIQLERILNPNGPTEGHLVRPSDGKHPKKIMMVNCVGARSTKEGEYAFCSGVCCLVTIKNAKLVLSEYPDAEIVVSYRDIRTPGKDYEEYYLRARNEGITFIRANVGMIEEDPDTKNLICYLETEDGVSEYEADLVVLSTTPYPSQGTDEIAAIMKMERGPSGYLKEFHARLNPINTKTPGVFIAGFAQGPKAVDASVNQGRGAAQAASILMSQGKYEIELVRAVCDYKLCSACELCVQICPYSAITIENGHAVVDEIKCRGCGACPSVCKNNAMSLRYYRNNTFEALIDGTLMIPVVKS